MNYLANNYDWIFSGIGVLIISIIIGKHFWKKKNKITIETSGDKSPIIKGNRNRIFIFSKKNKK